MKKFYDTAHDRLVFESEAATADFWDRLWKTEEIKQHIIKGQKDTFITGITKQFLPANKNIKVLEGGCGLGAFVYSLDNAGYDAHGIDYAAETVKKVKNIFPELNIKIGDVRKLPYKDNFFDGYWSLGVIEHFYDGYQPITKEMSRVIKPGGFLFLTFPHISPLRRLKIRLGLYPKLRKRQFKVENFYQFGLNDYEVAKALKKLGFRVVKKQPLDGLKGLKDETDSFKPLLQSIYSSRAFLTRLLSYFITRFMTPVSNHTILLVLKKDF